MDVQKTKLEIETLLSQIGDAQRKSELQRKLDDILRRHDAEADPARKATIAAELPTLRAEAETAANSTAPPAPPVPPAASPAGGDTGGGLLTKAAFHLVLLVTVLGFGFVFYYVHWVIKDEMSAIESVQFLLVLTLILAMFAFGALLVVRALFAPYDGEELQARFRMGREIFLVFSGIFGTIIGFYFGTGERDESGGGAPTVEVAFEDGRVTAAISGGNSPFTAIYTAPGETGGRVMDAEERVHSISVGAECPDEGEVVVIDGRGRRAEAKLDCDAGGEADNANAVENGAGNATVNETGNAAGNGS